jgi:uncharacterized delta-60 repeat protein
MVIQSDGRLLVAGSYSQIIPLTQGESGFALARYQTNGMLDTSFGNGGIVTTAFDIYGGGAQANALMIQPDEAIVAVGTVNGLFALARYDTNGTPDTTFGGGSGRVLTPVGDYSGFRGGYASAQAVATQFGNLTVQNPNKIVVAGQADVCLGMSGFAVVRYNLDGSLDTSFGNNGVVTNVFDASVVSGGSFGEALMVQGTLFQPRKITVAGYSFNSANNTARFAMARLNADGSFDTTFGTNATGIVTLAFGGGGDDLAAALALDAIGRAVVAGDAGGRFEVARLRGDVMAAVSLSIELTPTHTVMVSWPWPSTAGACSRTAT